MILDNSPEHDHIPQKRMPKKQQLRTKALHKAGIHFYNAVPVDLMTVDAFGWVLNNTGMQIDLPELAAVTSWNKDSLSLRQGSLQELVQIFAGMNKQKRRDEFEALRRLVHQKK
jgi:hypothetical protein